MHHRRGAGGRRRGASSPGRSPVNTTGERRPLAKRLLVSVGLLFFLVGGIYSGCLFFSIVGRVFSGSSGPLQAIPQLPGPLGPIGPGGPTPNPEEQLPIWGGQERVTILLLGIDQREDQQDTPTRSDTMILVTIDPKTRRAGMLSIPRDLVVPIPGYQENKINTAHFFGENEKPGNGPILAKRTIEYNFGVRVDYFARVDFHGFEKLIDAIDGVTVDVQRPIKDDMYPAPSNNSQDGGIVRVYIPSGVQHMNGQTALRFARSRHSENDFARLQRQQQVLLAAREQAFRLSLLPRLPQLLGILRESIYTDIPATDIVPLAGLARTVRAEDVVSKTIDDTMVIDVNGDGTMLIPRREAIRTAIEEVFSDAKPTPTIAPSPSPIVSTPSPPQNRSTPTRATATPARNYVVQVINGTNRDGYAAATAKWLVTLGYRTTEVAQATRDDHDETVIYDLHGNPTTARQLADLLQVPSSAIDATQPEVADANADFTIVLGFDARFPVPLD